MTRPTWTIAIAAALAACGGGMSKETRADITQQISTLQVPVGTCYAAALQANRRLRGLIVVEGIAEPSTGQFRNVTVSHDELRVPAVRDCVIAEVGKLKLARPTKGKVAFKYPLRFAPTK